MSKFVVSSERIFDALHKSGAITIEPRYVRRVVIDLKAGSIGMIYVEQFADDETLMTGLEAGLKVEQATAAPGELR